MWSTEVSGNDSILVSVFESVRKKVIGKPCEGELHARFDEGVMGESPLPYSTAVAKSAGEFDQMKRFDGDLSKRVWLAVESGER